MLIGCARSGSFALTNADRWRSDPVLALVAILLYDLLSAWRERGQWSDATWVWVFLGVGGLELLLHVATFVLASPGLLMLSLIGRLEHPMHLFYNVISSFRPPITSE